MPCEDLVEVFHYSEDPRICACAVALLRFLETQSHRYVFTKEVTEFLLIAKLTERGLPPCLPEKPKYGYVQMTEDEYWARRVINQLLRLGYTHRGLRVCAGTRTGWKLAASTATVKIKANNPYQLLPACDRPLNSIGYFYLIQRQGDGIYKIGITENPRNRLTNIAYSCGSHVTVILLCELDDSPGVEGFLKTELQSLNIIGEWFNFTEHQLLCIKSFVSEQPGYIEVDCSETNNLTRRMR